MHQPLIIIWQMENETVFYSLKFEKTQFVNDNWALRKKIGMLLTAVKPTYDLLINSLDALACSYRREIKPTVMVSPRGC